MRSAASIAVDLGFTLTDRKPVNWPLYALYRVAEFLNLLPQEVSISYLLWMCHQIVENPDWDIDKAHRWIGYVQGSLVTIGLSTVDLERERVRKIPSQKI